MTVIDDRAAFHENVGRVGGAIGMGRALNRENKRKKAKNELLLIGTNAQPQAGQLPQVDLAPPVSQIGASLAEANAPIMGGPQVVPPMAAMGSPGPQPIPGVPPQPPGGLAIPGAQQDPTQVAGIMDWLKSFFGGQPSTIGTQTSPQNYNAALQSFGRV